MIWTMKVELLFGHYAEEECIRLIEIDSSSTLEELHLSIQNAISFDNDHLYEFYISRTERSREREVFDDDSGGIYDTPLENLYPLPAGKKLFYLFDYGDHWLFRISRSRRKPIQPLNSTEYPRVVERIGENPEQYPAYD